MKIYVGNIPYKLSAEELREMFVPFGEVLSANVVTDKETGRSKGFGFVEFASQEEAENAIKEMDGKEVQRRQLKVSLAKKKSEQPSGRRDKIFI